MKRRTVAALLTVVLSGVVPVCQLGAEPVQTSTPMVGYAVISPGSGVSSLPANLQVFQTYGFRQESISQQAEIPAPQMTTSALLFVNVSNSLGRNTGVAIANPGVTTVQVILTLFRNDGIKLATKIIFIPARRQLSQMVTQLFSDQPAIPGELTGTLSLDSSDPVAIVALRFRGTSFSTETLSRLSSPTPVPPIVPGISAGGPSFILPNFVVGGGWATEIMIINSGAAPTAVRLDLFSADGSPLSANLNGVTGSAFTDLNIQAGGVLVIAPLDSQGNSQF